MLHLLLGLAAASGTIASGGAVLSIGATSARSCYEAAEARNTSQLAVSQCNAALKDNLGRSDKVATHLNRGILSLLTASHAAAESDFDQALALDPKQPEAYLNKGISLHKRGNSAAALPYLDRSIELRTRRPALAFFARALAREDVGNVPGAYADLRRARELAPGWNEPQVELARYQVRSR